jgi:hypothetical protein
MTESPTLFPSKYTLKVSKLKAFQLLRTLFYTPKWSQQPIDDIFEQSWSKQSPCNGPPCTLMRTRGKIEDAQKSRLKQSRKESIELIYKFEVSKRCCLLRFKLKPIFLPGKTLHKYCKASWLCPKREQRLECVVVVPSFKSNLCSFQFLSFKSNFCPKREQSWKD